MRHLSPDFERQLAKLLQAWERQEQLRDSGDLGARYAALRDLDAARRHVATARRAPWILAA